MLHRSILSHIASSIFSFPYMALIILFISFMIIVPGSQLLRAGMSELSLVIRRRQSTITRAYLSMIQHFLSLRKSFLSRVWNCQEHTKFHFCLVPILTEAGGMSSTVDSLKNIKFRTWNKIRSTQTKTYQSKSAGPRYPPVKMDFHQ